MSTPNLSGTNICLYLMPIVRMRRKNGLRHFSSSSTVRAATSSTLKIGENQLATAIMIAADAARTGIAADLTPVLARDPDQKSLTVLATTILGGGLPATVLPAALRGAEVVPSLLKRSTTTGPLGGGLSLEIIIPNDRPPQRRPLRLFLLVE